MGIYNKRLNEFINYIAKENNIQFNKLKIGLRKKMAHKDSRRINNYLTNDDIPTSMLDLCVREWGLNPIWFFTGEGAIANCNLKELKQIEVEKEKLKKEATDFYYKKTKLEEKVENKVKENQLIMEKQKNEFERKNNFQAGDIMRLEKLLERLEKNKIKLNYDLWETKSKLEKAIQLLIAHRVPIPEELSGE